MATTTSAQPRLRLITVPTSDIEFVAEQVRRLDELIDRATTLRDEAAAWLSRHAQGAR
jgi:hypothetical protein